ncbi:MAG: sulfate reduction electron transfer complex DsrMKJOP subunit DsrM [Thermodesulfobacteriota bacterium]|nr:sulfate reduction electron transfer complex DsrMKJOP subunit DsrM [Thermodesulfobacteriota bacterium]
MGLTGFIFSLIAVTILVLIPLAGVEAAGLTHLFGVIIPYLAVVIFFLGVIYRIVTWGKSPVPFRIPTTCGQEKSLPWLKTNSIDNPTSLGGVIVRMILEICCFRSLFRNTALDLKHGHATYSSAKWLWLFALMFHYSFLVVVLRHLRFFTEPVPVCINFLESIDGFLQVGLWPIAWLPGMLISGVVLLMAVTYLFLRRIVIPQLRYISLANDFFPLFLIMAIAMTGIIMRYLLKVDVVAVKELTMSLANLNPTVPPGIGSVFYIHLFLVCVLFAYFPFSKLMHLGGIFMSPTRNLVNNSRRVRHVNPWNYPVKTHTYEEYEDEFRELMIEAGLPVDKGVENGSPNA